MVNFSFFFSTFFPISLWFHDCQISRKGLISYHWRRKKHKQNSKFTEGKGLKVEKIYMKSNWKYCFAGCIKVRYCCNSIFLFMADHTDIVKLFFIKTLKPELKPWNPEGSQMKNSSWRSHFTSCYPVFSIILWIANIHDRGFSPVIVCFPQPESEC